MAPGHQGCARHALCTRVTATLPTPHTDPGGWSMGRHASPQPSRVLLRPLLQALSAGGPHTDSGESPSRLWPRLHYPPVHAASLSHGLLGSRPLTHTKVRASSSVLGRHPHSALLHKPFQTVPKASLPSTGSQRPAPLGDTQSHSTSALCHSAAKGGHTACSRQTPHARPSTDRGHRVPTLNAMRRPTPIQGLES